MAAAVRGTRVVRITVFTPLARAGLSAESGRTGLGDGGPKLPKLLLVIFRRWRITCCCSSCFRDTMESAAPEVGRPICWTTTERFRRPFGPGLDRAELLATTCKYEVETTGSDCEDKKVRLGSELPAINCWEGGRQW